MTTKQQVDATAYLVIEGTRPRYGSPDPETGLRCIEKTRIVALRTNRPAVLARDQVAIKVTVRLPVEAFDPLAPAALIVVPREFVDRRPIEVDVEDASEAIS